MLNQEPSSEKPEYIDLAKRLIRDAVASNSPNIHANSKYEMSDFKHLLSHAVLSREEERVLFSALREHRDRWLSEVLRSPMIIARSMELYEEVYDRICNQEELVERVFDQRGANILSDFWILRTDQRSELKENFVRSFPELSQMALEIREVNTNNTRQHMALVEQITKIIRQFPPHVTVLDGYLEEFQAYVSALITSECDEEKEGYINELGESAGAAEKRLLTIQSERENWQEVQDHIITHNQKLVFWTTRRYFALGISPADLLQQGNLGLLRAVELFDESRGVKFNTFASHRIRQAVTRYIMDSRGTVRLPVHAQETLSDARKKFQLNKAKMAEVRNFVDAVEDYVDSPAIVQYVKSGGAVPYSFSQPISEDEEKSFEEIIQDKSLQDQSERTYGFEVFDQFTRHVEEVLNEREKAIVFSRFGLEQGDRGYERTLEEISHRFGVTRETIRLNEKKAILKIQDTLFTDQKFRKLVHEYFDIDPDDKEFDFDDYVRILMEED